MNKLRIVLIVCIFISLPILFGIVSYILYYNFTHDYMTNLQIFKMFWKEYICIIILSISNMFFLNKLLGMYK